MDGAISQMFRRSEHMGLMDLGRNYFSQAVQMIAICRAVDLSKLDSLEKRRTLESVHMSIQTALDAVIVKKSEGGDSQDINRAKLAEAVAKLIENAEDLGLDANVIQETMKTARDKDDKTAKTWLPINRKRQIQQNEPPGDPIQLTIVIGMEGLTSPGLQYTIHTDSFGTNHTLNTVIWLLLQRGKVKLSDNTHFYPAIKNFSNDVSIKPLAFTQTLANLEQLKDLQYQQVTSPWESQQRQPPKANSRSKTHTIHALKDDGHPVIIKSMDGKSYKNIGNVWIATNNVIVLKDVCGTLQPALAIENGIKDSGLCHRGNGAAKSVDIKTIWERSRKDTTAMEFILRHESEEIPVSTAQPPAERVRTYSTFSNVSSANLPAGRTTPVPSYIVNTTAAEWVEEQRKAGEKRRAQEAAKQEDEARRAQEIQRGREAKREDKERKAQEPQQVQEAARKMQRAQQVAKREEEERKVQEILREREVAKWEVEKRKAQDIRREQEAAERADEERKEQISGEETKPEEQQDSSEDNGQEEQIQVPPQRQTRLPIKRQKQKEEEMQVAAMQTDEQARGKQQQRKAIVPECAPEPRSFWIDLYPTYREVQVFKCLLKINLNRSDMFAPLQISSEDTEPEERQGSSEDDRHEEPIQVTQQRQTRSHQAKEMQVPL